MSLITVPTSASKSTNVFVGGTASTPLFTLAIAASFPFTSKLSTAFTSPFTTANFDAETIALPSPFLNPIEYLGSCNSFNTTLDVRRVMSLITVSTSVSKSANVFVGGTASTPLFTAAIADSFPFTSKLSTAFTSPFTTANFDAETTAFPSPRLNPIEYFGSCNSFSTTLDVRRVISLITVPTSASKSANVFVGGTASTPLFTAAIAASFPFTSKLSTAITLPFTTTNFDAETTAFPSPFLNPIEYFGSCNSLNTTRL